MKIVHTYSGSRYMIDEEAKTFRRLPGQDVNSIDNDDTDQPYLEILHLRNGSPMEILWINEDGKEKVRLTTPVKKIVEISTI